MNYFIANWKANKNVNQSVEWAQKFAELLPSHTYLIEKMKQNQTKIIICPPMPFLFYVKQILKDYPEISFGAQDISVFDEGKHTGEVAASMLKGSIDYSIIGHSERRGQLHEDETAISQKMNQLQKNDIHQILCVRNENDVIYESATFVAYEPIGAIGTGKNMDAADVLAMKQKLSLKPDQVFIYGGSANAGDALEYLQTKEVSGFLVGTASLDPLEFISLCSVA